MENKQIKTKAIYVVSVILVASAFIVGWFFARKVYAPSEVDEISVKQKKDVKKDETADWLIYRDEEFGYEIKYPKDWYIENGNLRPSNPKNCGPNIDPKNTIPLCLDSINFSYYTESKKLSIEDFFEKEGWGVEKNDLYKNLKGYKNRYISGYTATMISAYDGNSSETLWIPLENGDYMSFRGDYLDSNQNDIFKRIIDTIKIIPVNNSYWGIYKNEKFGFQMKFPKKVNGKDFKIREFGDLVWFSVEDLGYSGYADAFKIFEESSTYIQKTRKLSWGFMSRNINNDQDLDIMIKDVYGIDCKLGAKTIDPDTGLYNIDIVPVKEVGEDGIPIESGCFLNWGIFFKYSPEKKVATLANIGQDASFVSESRGVVYDTIILNSFRFTK